MNAVGVKVLWHAGLLGAAVASVALPPRALAQDMDHSMMQMPMPAATAQQQNKPPTDHDEKAPASTPPAPATAGQTTTPSSSSTQDMPMDRGAMEEPAPTQPRTPIPALTDADRLAAVPPPADHPVHDNTVQSYILFDRLEAWAADPGTGLAWEGQAWIGTDLDRLWLRSEGEQVDGRLESADLEVLYGHSFSPWWDVVAGVRHDFRPGASQDFAAIGVMGLAPYKFEVAATAYVGQGGQTAARLEAEYETLFTNRLILQERGEANLYGKDDPRRGIGSGLSTFEAGLRLRYEFTRRFAPYIGIVHERAFGGTADLRRAEHDSAEDTRIVAGLRLWF